MLTKNKRRLILVNATCSAYLCCRVNVIWSTGEKVKAIKIRACKALKSHHTLFIDTLHRPLTTESAARLAETQQRPHGELTAPTVRHCNGSCADTTDRQGDATEIRKVVNISIADTRK